jgi:hypothetical protein
VNARNSLILKRPRPFLGSVDTSELAASMQDNPAEVMMEPTSSGRLPRTTTAEIRERWMGLLDLSYATRRVTHAVLESGVHAIVAPASCVQEPKRGLLEADLRIAFRQIPEMARPVRLSLEKIALYELPLQNDFRRWMASYGADIAAGKTNAAVFVDLAYLEASLLDQFHGSGVLVDFRVPMALFRRGALVDSANVLAVTAAMVFEGRSFADAAARLAHQTLDRLETYAGAFWKLTRLYSVCRWKIVSDRFVMEVPGGSVLLALHYQELRDDPSRALEDWRLQIESLLPEAGAEARWRFPAASAA